MTWSTQRLLPLLETAGYKVHASRRVEPGQAEIHTLDTDVIYVVDRISETALIEWFEREIAASEPIILIGEGLLQQCCR